MEIKALNAASQRNLPVLGICRGMQLVNVALGGTLHQHIPDTFGVIVNHQQTPVAQRGEATHGVSVEEGSQLASVLGSASIRVNSMHHQAVDRLGSGLRAVAWSPGDGVIEGLESDDAGTWLVGVQWHPEELTANFEHARSLFAAFAAACATARVNTPA